jgi:hypothetical protein
MIFLRKGTTPKLVLTPRHGFKRSHKEIELPLVYGHTCPVCKNMIQCVAKTPQDMDLNPYEETSVFSQGEKNAMELLKVVPNYRDTDSCYESKFFRSEDPSAPGLIHLRLKNHLIPSRVKRTPADKTDMYSETGERTCFKTGFFAMREDLLMKDFLLLMGLHQSEIEAYNLPKVAEFLPTDLGNNAGLGEYRYVPALGDAPPVIIVDRTFIKNASTWSLKQALEPFKKNTEA